MQTLTGQFLQRYENILFHNNLFFFKTTPKFVSMSSNILKTLKIDLVMYSFLFDFIDF